MTTDEDPTQPGGDFEETTLDGNVNAPPEVPSEFSNAASHSASNPFGSENIQGQQAQESSVDVDAGKKPIPSIIDLKHSPEHGPYERADGQEEHFMLSTHTPYQELLIQDSKVLIRIEKGHSSADNSNPGETRRIPSIMSMDQNLDVGPYDPH